MLPADRAQEISWLLSCPLLQLAAAVLGQPVEVLARCGAATARP